MASALPMESKKNTTEILCEIFQKLDKEVILEVAEHCQFDISKASEILNEMSATIMGNLQQSVNKKSFNENKCSSVQNYIQPICHHEEIISFIKEGYKIVILMRGLPGSGKSSLAIKFITDGLGRVNRDEFIFSTDNYFYSSGQYRYNPKELDQAHTWNQRRCFSCMKRGVSPIIIDNTNLETWEMKAYCVMAVEFGYMIEIAEVRTPWALNPGELAVRNSHGVEKSKIQKMLFRFQQNVTTKDLYQAFQLKYNIPLPQFRKYPPIMQSNTNIEQADNAGTSSGRKASQRDSTSNKRQSQVPIEYVHKFEMKHDVSTSPKKQPADVDELLTVNKEMENKNQNTEDLISFINEHKPSSEKEDESIKPMQVDLISKQLQENKEMMSKMMKMWSEKMESTESETSKCEEKITSSSTATITKASTDQGEKTKSQDINTQNEINKSDESVQTKIYPSMRGLDDLEEENKKLRVLLTKNKSPVKKRETDKITPPPVKTSVVKNAPNKFSNSLLEKEELEVERLSMFFSSTSTTDSSNEFEIIDTDAAVTATQNVKSPTENKKTSVPKFDSKAWGLRENALVSWDITSPSSCETVIPEDGSTTTENVKSPTENKKASVSKFDSKAWGLSENVFVSWDITSPSSCEAVIPEDGSTTTENVKSSTENKKTSVPKFDSKAWGLSDNALVSWDITSPSSCEAVIPEDGSTTTETRDQSTITTEKDFEAMRKSSNQSVTVLTGREVPITNCKTLENIPRKKITVDKGCMTDEEELLLMDCEIDEQVKKLMELFPNVPQEHILDVYNKCGKDFLWTVEIFSTCVHQEIKSEPKKPVSLSWNNPFNLELNDWNIIPNKDNSQESVEDIEKKKVQEEQSKQLKKQKAMMQMKKQLEQTVTIGKEHYSDHVWNIKSSKMGIPPPKAQPRVESPEMMTLDEDTIYISDDSSESSIENDEDQEDLVEMELGSNLIKQLESMFGKLPSGDNFKPVVQMPESLARQMHALYLESICRQIENQSEYISNQMKEDEEFAMKLQEQERIFSSGNNMTEIMDEELAKSLYKKDVEQWKNLTPDTLALKLTKQKLYSAFPSIDSKILDEVLIAHNNNYTQTIQAIMNSTDTQQIGSTSSESLMQPPISEITLNEMKVQEQCVNKVPDEADGQIRSAMSYRDDANRHMEKRRELLQLVNKHCRSRGYEIAMFYRSLAEKELKKAELANQHATQCFIQENAKKLQKCDTLDLHFLYVKAAIASLDIFIDYQISNLKDNNKPFNYYFVITGRGNRSENGKSRLRPAVMARLKKRKIIFTQVNPGMLKIKVQKNLPMSTDLEKTTSS